MLQFIKNKSSYHDDLKNANIDFLYDPNRAYFIVFDVMHEGNLIDVAIPLQSNISEITQKEGFCLLCNDTDHTRAGKVAGFNIAKAIPYSKSLFWVPDKQGATLTQNENVAKMNIDFVRGVTQQVLNNHANGKPPKHGIRDFNKTIEIRNKCDISWKAIHQSNTQPQKPKTNTVRQLNRLNKILPTNKSNTQQPQPKTQTQKQPDPTLITKKDPPKVNTNNNSPPPTDKTSNFKEFSKADTHDEKLEQAKILLNNPKFSNFIKNIPKDKVQGDAQKVDKRGNSNDDINKRN